MRIVVMTALLSVALSAAAAEPVNSPSWPARDIPAPEERGKPYPVPATKWENHPAIWGWQVEQPDGTGLSFGGVDQTAPDGASRTQIKQGGAWKAVAEDLRKANPLQKRVEQTLALRNDVRDALSRARCLFFDGKPAQDEAKAVASGVDPQLQKAAQGLAALMGELKSASSLGAYESGQIAFALKHLEAAAAAVKPFGAATSPEAMASLRRAQIELEIAAEAFDAEPPPRSLSRFVFEPKTKCYVLFGGEHFDYTTNDTWVFDCAKNRWFQRHPAGAPEPRFDAIMEAGGAGSVTMRGGCVYEPGKHYIHAGPAKWTYSVEKNLWAADGHQEALVAPDARSVRYYPPSSPEHFMKGERPNAAANEAKLKALPVNAVTRMATAVELGGRDWGTWAFDTERDMFYLLSGGHASYAGNDVARYHLATDRWEVTEPTMIPLGCCGTNEQYPAGVDYNGRPWCKRHTWNSHAYDPTIKRFVQIADSSKLDNYYYLYDPETCQWDARLSLGGVPAVVHVVQLRSTKHGTACWVGDSIFLLNPKTKTWDRLPVKGKVPNSPVDGCGMVYDAKRDRLLLITLNGYAQPWDGQIHAFDFATSQIQPLNPEGMGDPRLQKLFLRELAHDTANDLFMLYAPLAQGKAPAASQYLLYDPAKNRWVTADVVINVGVQGPGPCNGINYDAKRNLYWICDSGYGGGVCVLRFDPAKANIKGLKESASAPAPSK